MKKIYIFSLLVIAFCMIAGCKKSASNTQASVVGFWHGTYGFGGNAYYALFRSDGTIRVYVNSADTATASKADGTYTVSDSVRAYYNFSGLYAQSAAGKMNSEATTLAGTYGNGTNTGGLGIFSLSK